MKMKYEQKFFDRELNTKKNESNRDDPYAPTRRADKSRGFSQKARNQFEQQIKDEVRETLDDVHNESLYRFNK